MNNKFKRVGETKNHIIEEMYQKGKRIIRYKSKEQDNEKSKTS